MIFGRKNGFQRGLAMLLCFAMVLSYAAVPGIAAGETSGDPLNAAKPKLTLQVNNVNAYEDNEPVLIYGGSVESLGLTSFIDNEVLKVQNINLLPSAYTIYNQHSDGNGVADYTINSDGSVSVTNRLTVGYSYIYTYPNVSVDVNANIQIYMEYSGDAKYNLIFFRNAGPVNLGTKQLGGDFPAGNTGASATVNITEEMSADKTVTACKFYASGGMNKTVTVSDVRIVSSSKVVDAATEKRTGTFMDDYTALVIDHVGGVPALDGLDGAEYKVSAVLDCSEVLDCAPQQLKANTEKGYVVYVPTSQLTTLPAVGDYVDASFAAGSLSATTAAGQTLNFYDHDTYQAQRASMSGLVVNKTATPVKNTNDEFLLTLEAFATGETSSFVSTTPADIVLVLDQSASMYAPKGATEQQYDRWISQYNNSALTRISTDKLVREKGAKLGYYVAQSKEANRYLNEVSAGVDYNGDGIKNTSVPVYDWFIVQYVDGIGWVYVRVGDTTTSVIVDIPGRKGYEPASGAQYGLTLVNDNSPGSAITGFNYYESQYAALYESVADFVQQLADTGVEHRVAITGFSSPYYNGEQHYNGSGLYINGKYYLYDSDYKYMGYRSEDHYLLYAPVGSDVYESMKSILTPASKGVTWSDTLPESATLVPLNVDGVFSGDYFGENTKPTALGISLEEYQAQCVSDERYREALVYASGDNENVEGIMASVEAIRTNYKQTCPAVGLDMAQQIFEANSVEGRSQIVILFTDGVPTVGIQSDREDSVSANAGIREGYWSGLAGVRDAVNTAQELKQAGAQIYTIGTSGLRAVAPVSYGVKTDSETVIESVDGETFLSYVSSEYKNVICTHTVAAKADDNTTLAKSVLAFADTEMTSDEDYTKTSEDGSISVAFEQIIQSEFTSLVNLDKTALLKDVLSEYFRLNTVTASDIIISVAPYAGQTILGEHIFGNPVTLAKAATGSEAYTVLSGIVPTLSVSETEIAVDVTGFDYSANHVHLENGVAKGYKIIVQIPIRTAETFQGGDDVPTNAPSSGVYDGEGKLVQAFPIPEVDVAGVVTDKFVEKGENPDEYVISLEGFATGSNTQVNITKPADIVLVLDHSGSMRTPVGATEVLYSPHENYAGERYTGEGQLTKNQLDAAKGAHIGYYVAQSTTSLWWFVMRYDPSTQLWYYYSVPSTESIVNPEPGAWTEHTMTQSAKLEKLPDQLVFYKSQYAVLYDSILSFVDGLKKSGVEHNVGIVGFAGVDTDGTGLYVGGVDKKGDAQGFKKYQGALHHPNTTPERRAELYQLAMKNVQDEAEYAELLSNVESIKTNSSFTCPSAGLQLANELYEANGINPVERDRIVVLFTDGIPNQTIAEKNVGEVDANGVTVDQDYIYNEIVQKAYETKHTHGATLYSISTTTLGANADRDFLKYASSDYPNAVSYMNPGEPIAKPVFTSEVSSLGELELTFQTITGNVTNTVSLNNSAMMLDLLTKYFDLADGENSVSVYTKAYLGGGMWSDVKVPLDSAVISYSASDGGTRVDTITVTGFNYAQEYISDTPRAVTDDDGNILIDEYYGSKLVMEVRIKARKGFWGGNNVPTNGPDTGIYADGERVEKLPEPQVNVPMNPTVRAEDVTIYHGGEVSEDDLGVTVEVDGVKVTINEDGTFTPAEDWMDDFAQLTWEDPAMNPKDGNDPTLNTQHNTHTYTVVLTPAHDGSGENVEGEPVQPQTATDDGAVNILVPVITFEDSTVLYGETPDTDYFEHNDRVTDGGTELNPGVSWVIMGTQTPGTATNPDTEPDLSFVYTPVGTTGNTDFYHSDTKVNVTVNGDHTPADGSDTPVDMTDVVIFQWVHCEEKLDGTGHTHEIQSPHAGTVDTHEFWIHVKHTLCVEDSVVIDFGLSVNVDVLSNDTLLTNGTTILVGIVAEIPADAPESFPESCNGTFGKAEIVTVDGKSLVRYSLHKANGMEMDTHERFYYVLEHRPDGGTARQYYGQLTIIPATTIYFEDDFVTYTVTEFVTDQNGDIISESTTVGGWSTATGDTAAKDTQDEDRPGEGLSDAMNNYGYDSHYTDMVTYSNASAKWVTVNGSKYAKATFTFKGTGFDVISLTSADTGTIVIEVNDLNKADGAEGKIRHFIVDTYYGYIREFYQITYTYDGENWIIKNETDCVKVDVLGKSESVPVEPSVGETYMAYETRWSVDPEAEGALYQVPVMKVEMPAYSHYAVTITATYADLFDHDQNDRIGSYDFYLDAIRIYDPANDGEENEIIKGAYIADGEYLPTYQELRNLLIEKNTFDVLDADDEVGGIVFIDGNSALGPYPDGTKPANPVAGKTYAISDYLNFGPNNELYLAANQAVAFTLNDNGADCVQLALKTVGADSANIKIGRYDEQNKQIVWFKDEQVNTATDLYYDISDDQRSERTLIIMNSGSTGILSITNIKTSYAKDPYAVDGTVMLSVRSSRIGKVLEALNAGDAVTEDRNPQTGDVTDTALTMMVLAACASVLAVLMICEHQRKNRCGC